MLALACVIFIITSALGQHSSNGASLSGTVRGSTGAPVPNAMLQLESRDADRSYATRTDSKGKYTFQVLPPGVYVLKVQVSGYVLPSIPPLFIRDDESKALDFTLQPAGDSSGPQFYDQPEFTVAGVTDTTNLGGHGSDVIVRTREKLARDTASLEDAPKAPPSPSVLAAEKSLREAVSRDPSDFDANHRLGQMLLHAGNARDALLYLNRAAKLKPEDYQTRYEQARANAEAGNYDQARTAAQSLLHSEDTAEVHHLLADVAEKSGDPLEAVRQYQRAAELDPSEPHFFEWGAELLLHHAPEPALQVFTKGNRLFPRSERMLMGMGAADYAHGSYDDAVRHLCEASDLNPQDTAPYLFIGRMQHAENRPSDAVLEKLHRFVTLQPQSAEANYYYALALRDSRKDPREKSSSDVESLLTKAVSLNPGFAPAHLELGILLSERNDFAGAALSYEQALTLDPQMEEAHYRLAQAYRQLGKAELAKQQISLYDQCVKESAKRLEQERHDIRQFVYTLRDQPPSQTQ
jgi:tetratricopeptide (TPR) repeat protein